MRLRLRVPATTANLGPGFDCLGMALSLYNEVEFRVDGEFRLDLQPARCAEGHRHEKGISGQSVSILSDGKPNLTVPLAKNLVYQSFVRASDVLGLRLPPVTIEILTTEIPIARGLGSSAACIVTGVLAANTLACQCGGGLSFSEALDLAVDIEGHPDNVVPCAVGGMTVAVRAESEGRVRTFYSRIGVPDGLTFAALVPGFRLTTEDARRALPESYSRGDAVFNVGRAALLAASFASGDFGALRVAMDDRLHQPYRLGLIPHSAEVIEACRRAGSAAEFLSGAGPTIMAIVRGDGAGFSKEVSPRLAGIPGNWIVHLLEPDTSGAKVEIR
ncbi:MAG: homoserine kinase [Bacillota bacterium]